MTLPTFTYFLPTLNLLEYTKTYFIILLYTTLKNLDLGKKYEYIKEKV